MEKLLQCNCLSTCVELGVVERAREGLKLHTYSRWVAGHWNVLIGHRVTFKLHLRSDGSHQLLHSHTIRIERCRQRTPPTRAGRTVRLPLPLGSK